MRINRHFRHLADDYLFSTIAAKTRAAQLKYPHRKFIKLSIGDVTLPLPDCIVQAYQNAVLELGQTATFRGYGPETGYPWLKDAIAQYYAQTKQVTIDPTEIMVSDGAKSDLGNLLDLFAPRATVAVVDPGYPVYVESNLLRGVRPRYLAATAENNFLPLPNKKAKAEIIYLCNPGNPTGACYTRAQLQQWVDFARRHRAVILYDAAYESFVTDPKLPTSIFQIPGARECAIEICSFSKMAGFTGVRCGYTVIPRELHWRGSRLLDLWTRRQAVKFNGVSYPVQRAAAAVFTPEGQRACQKNRQYYQRNVRLLQKTFTDLHLQTFGGEHSPYLWVRCPRGFTAWQFFEWLLDQAGLVCTPGAGFGAKGEGYIRFTGFNTAAATKEACMRLRALFSSLNS